MLKANKASGVDGESMSDYEAELEKNIDELLDQMKKWSYNPCPVKRVYIPKANGKTRSGQTLSGLVNNETE